ncbi:MAG TPA: hypothetical protein VFS52_24110, partial [Steroidobacteraceae bacterium]|nr:hypothetical protein [Steroidobacteraceae bacterium]
TQDRVVRPITAPGEFPPGLDNSFSRTTSDVYLSKLLDGRIGLRGRVTDIFLGANWERRDYLYLGGIEDKYLGVSLLVSRRLGPRVTIEASAAYTDSQLREGGSYTDRTYALSLLRQIGNKTHLTLTGNRIDRTGISSAYTANWVLLGIEVNFAGADHVGGGDRGFAGGRPATRANTLPTIRQR